MRGGRFWEGRFHFWSRISFLSFLFFLFREKAFPYNIINVLPCEEFFLSVGSISYYSMGRYFLCHFLMSEMHGSEFFDVFSLLRFDSTGLCHFLALESSSMTF